MVQTIQIVQTLEPPLENVGHKNYRKGNPQEWSGVPKIFPKVQDVGNSPYKNKQTQTEQISNRDVHIRKIMGGESDLPTNPK